MRRAYLSLLGRTPDSASDVPIQVLGLPVVPQALTGVKWLRAGQVILCVCSRDDDPLALYVIHPEGRPQQIWGGSDLLMDQVFLKDLTPLYLPAMRRMTALVVSAYEHLNIEEMRLHKNALLEWENTCIEQALESRLHWKACRAAVIELTEGLDLPPDVLHRMRTAIQQVACPKREPLQAPIRIDLWGYPGDQEA